ncbi:MAG: hypothetical protein KKA05_10425 [Alphaproteobacteria bacterium]|nr:hypothetical protein [Alphaproteobacteria bacterium]
MAPRETKTPDAQPGDDHRLSYLLAWYDSLRNAEHYGFGHQQPLSFSEIEAFKVAFGLEDIFEPFDAVAIRALDMVFFRCLPKKSEGR